VRAKIPPLLVGTEEEKQVQDAARARRDAHLARRARSVDR
jgi:hypothetical protein